MRDIEFRGKTKVIAGNSFNSGKDDGEWVKGYIYNDIGCIKIKQFEWSSADYIGYEVDPETVGQYTGLTDKNNQRIYEGDIVEVYYNNRKSQIGSIKFIDSMFKIEWSEWIKGTCSLCTFSKERVAVVDNIYDSNEEGRL